MRLSRLVLTQFRNYEALTWSPGAARIAAIAGPNGSGKTNLLEAVSLLAPGRGLRGARVPEYRRAGHGGEWAVHGRFTPDAADQEEREVATGSSPTNETRRVFRLDGAAPRNAASVAAACAAVWLTPQMDRLFGEGASGRRRFLDRLVWAVDPGHAREVSAFETAMAGRNRLLARGVGDDAWLAGLEDSMARHAVAVSAARGELVRRLNAVLAGGAGRGFPAARLVLQDAVADRLAAGPAIAAEDWLRAALAAGRGADAASGQTAVGAHRADMGLEDAASGLAAASASTGQQKALLIGTVLGHAALIAEARAAPPLLLLDEPAVHLDEGRRALLAAALLALPNQVLLTATDRAALEGLEGEASFWRTGGDRVVGEG